MENNLRESFISSKDKEEQKYLKYIDLKFDYEINNFYNLSNKKYFNTDESVITERLSENFVQKEYEYDCNAILEKLKKINVEKFSDELAPINYRCENVPFYKKNYLKALVSNKRTRLINNQFDLDLM